jgi:subtilase family serine protease
MAPGLSNVLVYEADNCCYTWLDILKQMQEDNIAKQLSSSWLFEDDEPNADVVYQEFAMQGQSFFQCSGDYQAFYNGVEQWTDDPNVTLVGGTMLTTSASQAWSSETAWSNGGGIGTGGGISASFMGDFAIPSWQQGINMSLNRGSTNNRNVPDVSLVAYHCYVVWNNGTAGWWWGTSIAAPLWAGYASLANQQAVSFGEPTVGFLNPALYSIGKSQLYNSCFHDVKTGNNTNANTANLYFAVTGYDLCTGWGTPAGTNLLNALTEPFISGTVRNPNGSVTLTSATQANFSSRVLAATNLTSLLWQPIYTNTTGGVWQFTDTNAALYRSRFYRVSQP